MDINDFLLGLQRQLELENPLDLNANLKEIGSWDSISDMILISYVDRELGVRINSEDLEKITTVDSLLKFVSLK